MNIIKNEELLVRMAANTTEKMRSLWQRGVKRRGGQEGERLTDHNEIKTR